MPALLDLGFCRVVVYTNDHRPAHIHALGAGWEAIFDLHCPKGPAELREAFKLSPAMFRKLGPAINANLAELCDGWESIHGSH